MAQAKPNSENDGAKGKAAIPQDPPQASPELVGGEMSLTNPAPVFGLGDKLRNRHLKESAKVDQILLARTGVWYRMKTDAGSDRGWWHETDVDDTPNTLPPRNAPAPA